MAKHQIRQADNEETNNDVANIIADIEIVHIVGTEIRSSAVLNMNDINKAYNDFLNDKDKTSSLKKVSETTFENKS